MMIVVSSIGLEGSYASGLQGEKNGGEGQQGGLKSGGGLVWNNSMQGLRFTIVA